MSATVTGRRDRASAGARLEHLARTSEAGLIAIIVLMSLIAAVSLPDFRTGENIGETLNNAASVIVVAIGEALVLMTRQIDLSVGAILGLAAFGTGAAVGHVALAGPFGGLIAAIGQLSGLGPVGVILVALLIGAVLGLGNALLIDFVRMPAIIATLATLSIYSGLQVAISGGNQVYASQLPTWLARLYVTSFLGVQSFIWIAAVCVVVFSLVMRMTRWGRDLYAMGSNPEAARTIAIPIRRRTYEAFVVCGALAGLGGLLYAAQYGNVDATAGAGFNLTVIAAAVVGGVSLFGGSGTPIGAALGALLLGEIGDILQLLKISIFAQQTLQGIAIVGAVVVYALLTRRLQRPASRAQYIEQQAAAGAEGIDGMKQPPEVQRGRETLRRVMRWEVGLCLLIVLVTAASSLASSDFLTPFNLETMALSATVLGFLAIGVAPVIMAGDIDISIASTLALCGVVLAVLWQQGLNIWVASLLAIALGVGLGIINGLLTVLLELPSLAITLGTLGAYAGIAFLILQGKAITGFPDALINLGQGGLFGSQFPLATAAVLLAAVAMTVLIHGTTFGKAVFAIGGSRQAALYSGIAVTRTRIALFAISGGVAGLASIFYLGNFDTARADMASDQVLPAVTVAILGGVSAYGGKGTIPGVALALILLSVLEAGLGVIGLSGQEQTISIGILLIIAIGGGNIVNSTHRWTRRLPWQQARPLERKEETLVQIATSREH